jgi:hypothetical protein
MLLEVLRAPDEVGMDVVVAADLVQVNAWVQHQAQALQPPLQLHTHTKINRDGTSSTDVKHVVVKL